MSRIEQLSIYLLKPTVNAALDAIRDNVPYDEVATEGLPEGTTMLVRSSEVHPPNWLRFFPQTVQQAAQPFLRNASAGSILLLWAHGNWFAICFGTGWHLLRKDIFIRGFGLKAALSLVKRDTLKAVDVSTYDNFAKHRRISTSKGTTIDSFDIEGQLDLLKGVFGECAVPMVAQQIGGKDACVLWTRVAFGDLPRLCGVLLSAFRSSRVSRRYPVVNNVVEVRDPSELTRLDSLLDAALAANANHEVSIAPPEAVDWHNVQSFALDHANAPAAAISYAFADIRTMYGATPPECASMRAINVNTVTPAGHPGPQAWTLYDCLVTELADPTNASVRCILMAGGWYVVAANFVAQVNQDLLAINSHGLNLPDALPNENEGAYNARFVLANPATHVLLDKKNISYGGGSSRIEVCDVYTSAPCLYHIKDYHGSATLSHLFSQGTVSSRLLLEQDFREKILAKYPALPGGFIQADSIAPGIAELVYGIICEPARALPGGLPFFSKVRLLESTRELRRMGFTNVSIAKIARP